MTEDRENALQHAATRRGLSLICMADGSYALARYECTGATLDEIQAYLGTDDISEREQERHQAEERERQRTATEAMHNRLREIALEMSKLSGRKTDPTLSRNGFGLPPAHNRLPTSPLARSGSSTSSSPVTVPSGKTSSRRFDAMPSSPILENARTLAADLLVEMLIDPRAD